MPTAVAAVVSPAIMATVAAVVVISRSPSKIDNNTTSEKTNYSRRLKVWLRVSINFDVLCFWTFNKIREREKKTHTQREDEVDGTVFDVLNISYVFMAIFFFFYSFSLVSGTTISHYILQTFFADTLKIIWTFVFFVLETANSRNSKRMCNTFMSFVVSCNLVISAEKKNKIIMIISVFFYFLDKWRPKKKLFLCLRLMRLFC